MEKHEDNLDKLLKAELEKEAGEIMEEMDSDESLQDISFPEDLDEKMWSKIQEYEEQQKAYEKLSDADKEAIRLGREVQALRGGENTKDHLKKDVESDSYIDNVVPIEHVKHETDNKASDDGTNEEIEKKAGKKKVKKRKRHWKVYGIVAVLAMMWSMVSIGGTPFFSRGLNDIIGDREMVKVNTEREDGDKNKVDVYDESKVYEEIKEKFPNKTIWIYSGYDWQDVKDLPCMKYVDVMVDGEFVDGLKDNKLLWRGSTNQKVIDVQKSLEIDKVVLAVK